MCNIARIKLSVAEKKDLRKLSGVLVPIYASPLILLLLIALTNVPRSKDVPRSPEPIAVASGSSANPASPR